MEVGSCLLPSSGESSRQRSSASYVGRAGSGVWTYRKPIRAMSRARSAPTQSASYGIAGRGGTDNGDDGGDDCHLRSTWVQAAMVVIGEILGSGVLTLPYAMAKLGWVVGSTSCVLFGLSAIYSGLLLSRVRNDLYPEADNFGDVARLIVGPTFEKFTRGAIMANWFCLLPYYLVTASQSLISAVQPFGVDLCLFEWTIALMAILLVMLQLRTLTGLTLAAAISSAAAVILLVVMLVSIAIQKTLAGNTTALANTTVHTNVWPPSDLDFLGFYGAVASFTFAFQGQSMFLEIMREMKYPTQFSRSLVFGNVTMGVVYMVTSAISYASLGNSVESFLPHSVTIGPCKTIIGILLA